MENFELQIRTIKDKSENEIVSFIEDTVNKLINTENLIEKIMTYLETEGFSIKNESNLLMIILLACILADIGTQYSPYIKKANTQKIKALCKRRNLNYNQILNISIYDNELINIIMENFK